MNGSRKFLAGWNILLLSLAGLLIVYAIFRYIKSLKSPAVEGAQKEPETSPNADDASALLRHYNLIRQVLTEQNVDAPDTLAQHYAAQAAFETGNFASAVYRNNNNLFGMRQARVRETTSVGDKGGYASYANIQDSVIDRLMWDKYNKLEYSDDVKAFVQAIYEKKYFEAKFLDYYNGVRKWAAKLIGELNRG